VALTSVMGQSRVFFAMARNGEMPQFLSRLNRRFETPIYSILLSGIVMMALASSVDIAGLASLGSFCVLLTHILVNYAALKLRGSAPRRGTSSKAPLHELHAAVGLLLSLALTLSLAMNAILMGLGVSAIGLVWYWSYAKVTKGSQRALRSGR
jgi:APA family basic amino acid/polyamine antiporter